MTHETKKACLRRVKDKRFTERYFSGYGIDVGSGDDSLANYGDLFPLITGVRSWDMPDGDAQYLENVPAKTHDFLMSSHCLEHLKSPQIALKNWITVVRPGGYLVITVPDEDLYEQGQWPSTFNPDHKWSFTISKPYSWSPRSLNVMSLLYDLDHLVSVLKVELLDEHFDYNLPRCDQSLFPLCEPAIEIVLRKK
jgi:SAM-dependent methyltransferase